MVIKYFLIFIAVFSLSKRGLSFGEDSTQSLKDSKDIKDKLISEALNHPTSYYLKNNLDAFDLQKSQNKIIEKVTEDSDSNETHNLFNHSLSPAEVHSILHQRDLFHAIEKNKALITALDKLGFDHSAYYRGTFDSDLGKLGSFKSLLYENSPKGTLLLQFMQGIGPRKSIQAIKDFYQRAQLPYKPFLNPNIELHAIRSIFKKHPILQGFFHEFPGMINAVISYELGTLSKKEFLGQVLVNLSHSGPAVGYWGLLTHALIPQKISSAGDSDKFNELIKGSSYENSEGSLIYRNPILFESFVSSFFDRLSQATRRGYLKIDHEIGGNPIENVKTLLLGSNIKGTIEQIAELSRLTRESKILTQKQRDFLLGLFTKGETYLNRFHQGILQRIKVGKKGEKEYIEMRKHQFLMDDEMIIYKETSYQYPRARELIREQLNLSLKQLEEDLGDPFIGDPLSNEE